MKTLETHPPNFSEIKHHLPELANHGVFTFGNTLYNPYKFKIDPSLMKHEEMHSTQQSEYQKGNYWIILLPKIRVKNWWDRYLKDSAFRLSQELPAYQVQLWVLESVLKPKELEKALTAFAKDLTSPLYGNRMSIQNARKALQSPQLIKFKL